MNLQLRAKLAVATLACAGMAISGRAAAQPAPVAQHTEAVTAAPPPVPSQVTASLSAGVTLNAGNTEAYSGNAGGRLGWINHPHQLSIDGLGTLGYTKANPEADVEQTSASVIGRARYDLFLSRMDALFIAIAPRRDTFAGLNLRMQNQIGYLRNIYFPSDNHRFWTELGYDLTYDVFARVTTKTTTDITDDVNALRPQMSPYAGVITQTTTGSSKPEADVVHSARIFFGYTNLISPSANLNLGAETLLDFEDAENVRVNGIADLTSSVAGAFKLGIQSRVFFDNKIPPTVQRKVDAMIAVQLIYTFDSLAGAPKPPPCDCTAEVNAANAECALKAAQTPVVLEPGPVEPAPAAPAVEPAPAAAPEAAAPAAAPAAPAPR